MNYLKKLKLGILALSLSTLTIGCNESQKNEEVNHKVNHLKNDKQENSIDELKLNNEKLAENKELVAEFIEAMRTSNVDKLKTMITEDFSWWIIGKPEYLATGGEHDTAYFLGFFKGGALFPDGADFKATSMISEGNTVAAEAEFKAKTVMGTEYENYYHFLFKIENGKIKRMKEYMDTYHAKVTFGL